MATSKVSATVRVFYFPTVEREKLTLLQLPQHIIPCKYDKPLTLLPFIMLPLSNNFILRHLRRQRKRPKRVALPLAA